MERIFLLGGYDLEMLEIRRLLISYGDRHFDANLNWSNAHISAYAPIIAEKPDSNYFGIELKEDYPLPKHYTRIDHHNDYNNRPAAILQVAEILGITPDRHLKLVAANDAGYIPAMQALGATDNEIADIRRQDRAAQGVTEKDERLAEKSIAENLTRCGDLVVVHALGSRFSPICDRLFPYRSLLIYTDDEWTFYGEGKTELVRTFSEAIAQKRVYHGGGDHGYIGAARRAFTTQQILEHINTIQQQYERI